MDEKKEGCLEYSARTGWVPHVTTTGLAGIVSKLATALAKAQGEMEGATRGSSNPAFRSKYADLASVWDAIREPLSKHGLSVVQLPCQAPDGHVGLVTMLLHESGESISQVFYMPVKDRTNAQAVGSALTYARRYSLMAVCGIAPEDDDGNGASGQRGQSAPQQVDTAAALSRFESSWAAAGTLEQQKTVFTELRASAIPDQSKMGLLSKMADTIKAATGGNGATGPSTSTKGKK